jgi:hypothetical protein
MTAGVSVVSAFLIQRNELKSPGPGTYYNLSVGTISYQQTN